MVLRIATVTDCAWLAIWLQGNSLSRWCLQYWLTGPEKYETHPEKSDSLDALGVAKVLIQRIDSLPDYRITPQDELSKQIKELVLDREFLVKEQTRLKNQLHRLLYKSYNSEYREKFRDLFCLKALEYWLKYPMPKGSDTVPVASTILKHQTKRKVRR